MRRTAESRHGADTLAKSAPERLDPASEDSERQPAAVRPRRLLLVGTFLLLVLIWGTTWAAIRLGLEGGVPPGEAAGAGAAGRGLEGGIPPWTGAALRFGLGSVILLSLAPLFGVKLGQSAAERRLWLINTVCTFCIAYGVLYWAEQWVPSGLAAVIFAIFPLCTALFAHPTVPGERLNLGGLAGILVGFAGLAVIFSEDFALLGGRQVAVAAAVLVISPVAAAVGNVATKKWGHDVHPLSIAAVPMGFAALLLGAVAAVVERGRPIDFNLHSVGALLYLAVFGSAVTFTLYFWLLRHVSVTTLSFLNYATPVVAVLVGTLGLGEPLTGRTVAGALLVVAGVAVALRAKAAAHRAHDDHSAAARGAGRPWKTS
jgi:drug/metabolite transporter (DMT)-like permease